MLYIKSFTFNTLLENTYLVYDDTKQCIVVDPGCYSQQEKNTVANFIYKNKLQITHLINTHCHIDHVVGNHFIKTTYQVPLSIHSLEKDNLKLALAFSGNYNMPNYIPCDPDVFLNKKKYITVGNYTLDILFLPGHSLGHIALYEKKNKLCIAGDVLFKKSIGRTDLPGGDYNTLMHSIKNTLFLLDNDTTIYPGHGKTTTIGNEKKYNSFFK